MAVKTHNYPDARQAAVACGRYIAGLLDDALRLRSQATFAVSGGTSPKAVFAQLSTAAIDWSRVHVFWVDERPVPPEDPQSNYGMAKDALMLTHIPPPNIHRMEGEVPPEQAAANYSAKLRKLFGRMPCFDVVHLGIGADGHTASLFPGEALIGDREGIAAAVYVEKMKQHRITLLPGPLLASRNIVFFGTGADKAPAIGEVMNGPYDPSRLPAQVVARAGGEIDWFLDQAAAAQISGHSPL